MLNRLINRHPANNLGDRRDQRIGISTCVNKKATTEERPLFEGSVDGEHWLWNNVFVVDIGGDADDAMRRDINTRNEF